MRQRKLKYVNESFLNNLGIITKVINLNIAKETYLEIGSGKGRFITELANHNKKSFYIAVEKNADICYRIYEKKLELKLDNLLIINLEVSEILEMIPPASISGIYLNFSDPWPKKKHHKRRLTDTRLLKKYYYILEDDAFIQFRTDHEEFFNDSLENFNSLFKTIYIDYNLAPSLFMTEYEIKKRQLGPIYEYLGGKNVKQNI